MLKAKLDAARKNKKGFSLIELIIVVAIMVALIAVLAPSYVKYVQKSRDAAMDTACEDFVTAVKTELSDPDPEIITAKGAASFTLTLEQDENGKLTVTGEAGDGWTMTGDWYSFGVDSNKKMGSSNNTYEITVSPSGMVTYVKSTKTA